MQKRDARRDYGSTWKSRLAESRARAAGNGPRLSPEQIADLRLQIATLDVTSPPDTALLWSGRDILTGVPLDEAAPDGSKWWDKLSCREAELFSALAIACRLEDTPAGEFLTALQLNYRDDDPLFNMAKDLWGTLSHRFAGAAAGRVEIICEGAFENSVFRSVELDTLLANALVSAINGLDRRHFPSNADDAFRLLRRWDVERSRRYAAFIEADPDSTPHERAAAIDDFREIQLWYEQDFFDDLGPGRTLPDLPDQVLAAADLTEGAGAWKYSSPWREFIQQQGAMPQEGGR
ncbi:hypothetical protein [Tahibacter caeni]|uniref:hypothetical protein n=1 Tax=Tahibacter caeni TaxID=1453545 RepID=UPI0021477E09|nr:hypothetical protein [Tahibacter caeni]